jgi:hypothetical protein
MNKTWFAQLIAAFVLAAVAGLYLVPRTLSAEEMNQIVGACSPCGSDTEVKCSGSLGVCDVLTVSVCRNALGSKLCTKGPKNSACIVDGCVKQRPQSCD